MKNATMKCNEIRELMPDLAAGLSAAMPEMNEHIQSCPECAETLAELSQTMALLDEWQAPEPSPYFDTRLKARLREEAARQPGWMSWFRKPALAFSMAAVLVMGVALFRSDSSRQQVNNQIAAGSVVPGTALGDLQALDKNHELYSDFDVLDDLEVQQDVTANP